MSNPVPERRSVSATGAGGGSGTDLNGSGAGALSVLALDLSLTSTGWAHTDGGIGTIEVDGSGVERLDAILGRIIELSVGADLVLVEGYSMGSRKTSHAHALGELGGLVRWSLWVRGIPYVEVPPSCLKKLATGKGNAKKEAVLAEAIRRLGYAGCSTDEADALWLLTAAQVRLNLPGAPQLPQTHLDGLTKVQWAA